MKPGQLFREAVKQNQPFQCLGAVNAYSALLARRAGAKSIYLSGSGVATASYGLPDLGITNLTDICEDINRITSRVPDIPLLVDIDTGFGNALSIQRTIQNIISCVQYTYTYRAYIHRFHNTYTQNRVQQDVILKTKRMGINVADIDQTKALFQWMRCWID